MSKERKLRRRAARKARRQHLDQLSKLAKRTPGVAYMSKGGATHQEMFNKYWPFFREGLELIQDLRITRVRADEKLENIIELGDKINSGKAHKADFNEFQKKLTKIWRMMRIVLNALTIFTGDKFDDIVDKILDIGNWITGIDDDSIRPVHTAKTPTKTKPKSVSKSKTTLKVKPKSISKKKTKTLTKANP